MSGINEENPEENIDPTPVVEVAVSPLEQLRAEYTAELEEPRLFKKFPSRGRRLAGEYKPLPLKIAKEAIEKDSDPDMLIGALIRILIHDETHEAADKRGLVPLGTWANTGEEYRFDHRLCDLLGVPKGNSHEIALRLFDNNDLALATQAGELGVWSTDTQNEKLQDFPVGS